MNLPPMRTATGLSTEAVFIFNNMLRKLAKSFRPVHMAAVFESIGPTLREQEYAEEEAPCDPALQKSALDHHLKNPHPNR